ncbi:hypothetical protein [Cupriavidus neocaledonicus]|uniref:Uncharacterized protein n=1 Tax=Cupriavidus neocaledonicus TaxID=1040979 RepID=A0A375HNU1_9BURK|nr:hypothetical protein [Cupriavidus neocaledonicus]SOZ40915.1 conserved hypothetical protein [Cupriavidus neocaledonicus]SPD59921.1 conserved protein of unknown function [Cupriavidus neocaledonicus]
MTEAQCSYKGFQIVLCVPDTVVPGTPCGRVELKAPDGTLGIRFTPDWPDPPASLKQAEEWLFAYAAGIVDCELAGGFGIDLHHD